MIRVIHGDCREIIPALGVTVDAVVTDPPYGLEFMGQDWDKLDGGLPQEALWKGRRGKGGASVGDDDATPASRHHVGFGGGRSGFKRCTVCGKRAFSGSPCRCETPQWVTEYPEGPPSSAVRMQRWHESWAREVYHVLRPGGFLLAFGGTRTAHRLVAGIEDAGFVIQDTLAWLYATGFPKNKAHLKPAYEPIVLAYKPGGKRTMQVDECRIPVDWVAERGETWLRSGNNSPQMQSNSYMGRNGSASGSLADRVSDKGRWPANICHDGSDEVVAAFPETTVTGFRSAESKGRWQDPQSRMPGQGGTNRKGVEYPGDSTNASRFFFSAKAGAQDRWGSRHPTVKPVEMMKWLVALVCPPGGTVLDPFAGSGTTAVAALGTGRNAILIEREDQYVADILERVAFYEGGGAHSVQAKNRNRTPVMGAGDLFAEREVIGR